jgi:feruloyl-CoA synthase
MLAHRDGGRRKVETVLSGGAVRGCACTPFRELESAWPVLRATGTDPDSAAKILFTSGSTAHRRCDYAPMLCGNQQTQLQALRYGETLWCWSTGCPGTTAGGNANFGTVLYNSGQSISMKRPVQQPSKRRSAPRDRSYDICQHAARIRLIPYLRGRLRMMFYAGAAMSQHVWDELKRCRSNPAEVVRSTGLGATKPDRSPLPRTGSLAIRAAWVFPPPQ